MNKFHEIWHNSKPIFESIWSVFAAIGVVLGVLIPISNFLFPDTAEPRYMVISDELVIASPTNRIKIYHDSTAVNNIRILKIALWNEGNTYLERNKFLTPHIAEIENTNASIHQVDLEKKSRQDLKFQIKENLNKNSIYIFIAGNESLERNDGLILKVFYTSDTSTNWNIKSRILGIPTGFSEYSILNVKNNENHLIFSNSYLKTILFSIYLVVLGFLSYRFIKFSLLFTKTKGFKYPEKLFLAILFYTLSICLFYRIFNYMHGYFTFPDFLIKMGVF